MANSSSPQAISDGLKGAGFSPEIHDLNYFQDDYGLKPIDGDDDDDGNEDDDDDDDDEDDIDGSEGYEIVEGNDDADDLE